FDSESPALERQTGACACCGTRAFVDRQGTVYMLFRAATEFVNRDMYLLTSKDNGVHFQGKPIGPWRVGIFPMSSESLAQAGKDVMAAWETNGQVFLARIDPETGAASSVLSPPGAANGRKHPAVAGDAKGETILVWTEGTGWQKGGALAWHVFD